MGSPSNPDRHAVSLDAAVRRSRRADLRGRDHGRGHSHSPGRAGDHQRLRHARATGVRGGNGRGSIPPLQRHRAQLIHGECEPCHRPVDWRHPDCGVRRGLVLRAGCDFLHRSHCFAPGDARGETACSRDQDSGATGAESRIQLRHALRAGARLTAARRARRDDGHAVYGVDAGDRRHRPSRRPPHTRVSHDGVGCRRARGRVLSCVAYLCARPRSRDRDRLDHLRSGAVGFFLLPGPLALHFDSALRRWRHDGRDGVDEYHPPDDRR